MNVAKLLFALGIAVVFTVSPCTAQVALHFDNGAPDFSNGWEATRWTVADDFEVPYNAVATRVTVGMIDTTCTFPANWDGILRWWILNDDGGLPGTAVVSTGISPQVSFFIQQDDCSSGGWAAYEQNFSLGQQVALDAGVRYWLAIHMAGDWSARDDLYWAESVGGQFNYGASSEEGTAPWSYIPLHLSFMILAYGDDHGIFVDEFESGDVWIWSTAIT